MVPSVVDDETTRSQRACVYNLLDLGAVRVCAMYHQTFTDMHTVMLYRMVHMKMCLCRARVSRVLGVPKDARTRQKALTVDRTCAPRTLTFTQSVRAREQMLTITLLRFPI